MESVLLDTMYRIPSEDNVSKVVVDETVIKGEAEPLLVYESSEGESESADDDDLPVATAQKD